MLSIDVDHGLSIDRPADLPPRPPERSVAPAMLSIDAYHGLSIDAPADLPRVHQAER